MRPSNPGTPELLEAIVMVFSTKVSDIEQENILVNADNVKIADFG